MPQVVIENPVLNSPFEEPKRHFKFTEDGITDAFKRLVSIGELTRSEIREEFSNFNPAYVAAILAKLPNIKHARKPIRLWITGNS